MLNTLATMRKAHVFICTLKYLQHSGQMSVAVTNSGSNTTTLWNFCDTDRIRPALSHDSGCPHARNTKISNTEQQPALPAPIQN